MFHIIFNDFFENILSASRLRSSQGKHIVDNEQRLTPWVSDKYSYF